MNKGLAFLGLLAGMVATAFGGNVTNHVAVDQTWTAAGSPYNICYWDCTVQAGATLTIEPGVRVNCGSRSGQNWTSGTATLANALKIEGTLLADGATFTSYAPDEDPQAGDWSNLQFLDGSMGRLTNCTIEYGGAGAVTYGQVQLHGARSGTRRTGGYMRQGMRRAGLRRRAARSATFRRGWWRRATAGSRWRRRGACSRGLTTGCTC